MTRDNGRGQATVELALLLPLLMLLLLGVFQFGAIIQTYIGLTNSSRAAARAGSLGMTNDQILATARARLPEIAPDRIQVEINPVIEANRTINNYLWVRVRYSLPLMMPFLNTVMPDPLPLQSTTHMRIERLPTP